MRSDRYTDPVVLMYRNFQMNIDLAVGLSFLEGETRRLILGLPRLRKSPERLWEQLRATLTLEVSRHLYREKEVVRHVE
ncbi:hypothetical protein [Enterococcus gilvus]|uniref:hypothetical protein n=1 Tax=Enterococcus gilvus TaxID=160453 RepID=UPI0028D76B8F|nr:hypothetical protein [Enterococcus gilvus]